MSKFALLFAFDFKVKMKLAIPLLQILTHIMPLNLIFKCKNRRIFQTYFLSVFVCTCYGKK